MDCSSYTTLNAHKWARDFILRTTSRKNLIPLFYKELLRFLISKLSNLGYIDSENNIWVATSTGLSKISTSEISLPYFSDEFEFLLYPNPTISELFLVSNKDIETLIMTNIQGKQVAIPKENTDRGIRLDVSLLNPGFYILDIHTENLNLRRKVLIR